MAKLYDENIDYQALINEAVAKGDYLAAAKAEQSRNAKIADLNAAGKNQWNATQTNNYAGWLDTTDYGTIGKQQMASGASADEVLKTYNSRLNKASGTIGLNQYANDALQQEMLDYIMNYNPKPTYDSYAPSTPAPTYTSKYDAQIEEMLNQILNREDFSYDAASDPLYQQYAAMYSREGDRAMRDTMAEAAASAGGMNSYAITAAQQANDYYASQAADRIPELYQLAYSMYLDDKESQVQDLGLLQSMDDKQYSRYRDTMSDWRDDRNFAYNMYRDDMGDYQWRNEFDTSKDQWQQSFDTSKEQWNQSFDYDVGRDEVSDNRYESETAYNKAMQFLSSGVMPDTATLAAAGITEAEASAYIAAMRGELGYTGGGSSGSSGGSSAGSSGGSSGGGKSNYDEETAKTQQMLVDAGYDIAVDGIWGPKTQAAYDDYYGGGGSPNIKDYSSAAAYMKENGASSSDVAGLMTKSEWSRRKASDNVYGQGSDSIKLSNSYEEYLNYYIDYVLGN